MGKGKKCSINEKRKMKEARLPIVANMLKRGHTYNEMVKEVERLTGEKVCTLTIRNDVQTLLEQWRAAEIKDIDQLKQLELKRIEECIKELWLQWEKSKIDYQQNQTERMGKASKDGGGVKVLNVKQIETNVRGFGNPAYIAEIRKQSEERRKILGLYAPEQKEIKGELSFANLLMESGIIEEGECCEVKNNLLEKGE